MTVPNNDTFPSVSKADWIAQVGKDLKDPQAYDSLRWLLPEGFTMEPFYTVAELDNLPLVELQGAQKIAPGWLNAPYYAIFDSKENAHRLALTSGADALVLGLNGLATPGITALSRLLNDIKLSEIPVFFYQNQPAAEFVRTLQMVVPYQLKGGLLSPPDDTTAEATRLTMNSPQFRTVSVSGQDFHNAGATATQELAFLLARLTDVYDGLTEEGLTIEQLVSKTTISVAVGTSYLPEIAKLRALRVLVVRFLAAYTTTIHASRLALHGTTSPFYETSISPYTNLLRGTTEAMAAVIGGVDVLTVRPYNAGFGTPDEFAQRIARNVSLLLKEESYFDKVADPSAGSFYIETMTHKLVESAWALFLQVEQQGGLSQSTDFVQSAIEQAYEAKVQAVRQGREVVGVTKFRFDEGETPEKPIHPTGLNELPIRRLAADFE